MDESDIKAAVLARIRRQAKGRQLPVVASEFSLNGTGIRADLALLDRGIFYGIEIKSGSDTLKRLPSQMEGYARYFDRTELVVAPRHLRGLRSIDLHGAEVWRIEVLTDWQLHASGVQRQISGQWLLHLLTAEEERRAERAIERQTKNLAENLDQLRRLQFQQAFERRYSDTSLAFWNSVHGRRIIPDDLKLLSRFHADRQHQRNLADKTETSWERWTATMQACSV